MTSVETVGDIQATCDVSGLPLEGPDADSRIQGGGREIFGVKKAMVWMEIC